MDVEAQRIEANADEVDATCTYATRQTGDATTFRFVHGVDRVGRPGDGPDLDRDSLPSVQGQEVDLTGPGPNIGVNHAQAVVDQEAGGQSLAKPAQRGALVT
jgi:hypothetical protein